MKKGKFASTLLIILLILGIPLTSVGANPGLPNLFVYPTISSGSSIGEVFQTEIRISNSQNLWFFEIKLAYNTSLLDVLEIVRGPLLPSDTYFYSEIHEADGYVMARALALGTPIEGNGTLATITFQVTSTELASCPLDLYETTLKDNNGQLIPHDVEDGVYIFGPLEVTVATDKPQYFQGDTIEIYGNLTLGGHPYEGLVALQVDKTNGETIVARTLQTGPNPSTQEMAIIDVYTCDSEGNPKEDFQRGPGNLWEYLYINVTVTNNGNTNKDITILANAYDDEMVPMGNIPCVSKPLLAGRSTSSILSIIIPIWASLGNGVVYASVFTDFPKDGGTAYCPEKMDTFQIVDSPGGSSQGTQSSTTNSTVGNYSLTFELPSFDICVGNYSIYVTSNSSRQATSSAIVFEQKLLGDVNGDHRVDVLDQRLMQIAMFTVPGDEYWNPNADMNGDDRIDVIDQRIQQLHMFESAGPC